MLYKIYTETHVYYTNLMFLSIYLSKCSFLCLSFYKQMWGHIINFDLNIYSTPQVIMIIRLYEVKYLIFLIKLLHTKYKSFYLMCFALIQKAYICNYKSVITRLLKTRTQFLFSKHLIINYTKNIKKYIHNLKTFLSPYIQDKIL